MDRNATPQIFRACTLVLLLLALLPDVGRTQTTVTYSYDSLQRVTSASSSSGSGVQYQYDANGNLLTVTRTNPTAVSITQALDVSLSVPGQSVTLSFSVSAGQTITLNANSISMAPSGTSVAFSVYNSSGIQMDSTSGTTNATLTLSNFAAGTYTVVVSPPQGATGVLQMTLAAAGQTGTADAPLPLWAYVALALGFFVIAHRRDRGVLLRGMLPITITGKYAGELKPVAPERVSGAKRYLG